MHLNFTVFGDNGRVPDCVVVMANPMDGSRSTVQQTLHLEQHNGWQFWQRIMAAAHELARPMGYGAHVAIFCRYGVTAPERDSAVNYRRALMHTMEHDRSHKTRVNAASTLADLRTRTLQ
jgi:hypothetical protein